MIILPKAIKRLYAIPSKILGFPGGSVVKNPLANGGDVGPIPWLGRSQPVFFPGKSHGERSVMGCSPWGYRKESDTI